MFFGNDGSLQPACAAAVLGREPCSWPDELWNAPERSHRCVLCPVMSSKMRFCDNFLLFKKECLDLLIDYSYTYNMHVLMDLKIKWLLGWWLVGWVKPGIAHPDGIAGEGECGWPRGPQPEAVSLVGDIRRHFCLYDWGRLLASSR